MDQLSNYRIKADTYMSGIERIALTITLLVCCFSQSLCQEKFLISKINYDSILFCDSPRLKEWSRIDINNENICNSFFVARAFFPEMDGTRIHLLEKKMKNYTMLSQPWINLTREKENREYVIFVSEEFIRNSDTYQNLTPQVLIGWFGHEISHILDYRDCSNFGMLLYGLKYIILSSEKRKSEYLADSLTIAHGLGYELLESVEFCLNYISISQSYKKKIMKYYLSPESITIMIHNHFYNDRLKTPGKT
jgi:hypothetical protein